MTGKAIISLLESKTAITDLIGSGASMRLTPKVMPQNSSNWPVMTYNMQNVIPVNDGSGKSDFEFRSVDFFAYAKIQDDAEDLINTVREELEDERGTWGGVEVNHILYMTDSTDYLEDLELHTHQLELQFNYRR